jgi:hypothetical protein
MPGDVFSARTSRDGAAVPDLTVGANPFAGRTRLGYELPAAAHVRLAAYDVLGREVAVLVEGDRPAGRHEIAFDGTQLGAGVYLVRMTTGSGFTRTLRVTVRR